MACGSGEKIIIQSMLNITLVSTRHQNLGKCNSYELYQIIESINPDVIFEEMPPSLFDKYYVDKSRSNLESDAISNYILNHKIEQVPVDSENLPSEKFFQKHKFMMERVEKLVGINGIKYRESVDHNKIYIERYGFSYLNSSHSINMNNKIYSAIQNGLEQLNNDKFFDTFKRWKEIHEKRENHMLKKIYRYSEEHSYRRAIFLVGAAHRGPIINKISESKKDENVKLNWIFEE